MNSEIVSFIRENNFSQKLVPASLVMKTFSLTSVEYRQFLDKLYKSGSIREEWFIIDNKIERCLFIKN